MASFVALLSRDMNRLTEEMDMLRLLEGACIGGVCDLVDHNAELQFCHLSEVQAAADASPFPFPLLHSKSVLYGAFVWARRALNSPNGGKKGGRVLREGIILISQTHRLIPSFRIWTE